MVADVESLDSEPVLGTLSNCDEGRLRDFFVGDDSERAGDDNLLLLPFNDDGGVGLCPI